MTPGPTVQKPESLTTQSAKEPELQEAFGLSPEVQREKACMSSHESPM